MNFIDWQILLYLFCLFPFPVTSIFQSLYLRNWDTLGVQVLKYFLTPDVSTNENIKFLLTIYSSQNSCLLNRLGPTL